MKKSLTTAILTGMMMMSATAMAAIPDEAVALEGIAPGATVEEATAAFGAPTQVGSHLYFKNGVIGHIHKKTPNIIHELETKQANGAATPAGIKVGMSESALTEVYGEADKVDYEYGEVEYEYFSMNGLTKLEVKVVGGTITKIEVEMR